MRSFFKLTLTAIAFFIFAGTFGAIETKAQGPLGEALRRMEAHNKALTSLKANVVMEKFNAQLGERDLYEGKVIYLPQRGQNAFVRIDWTKPRPESLAVVKKEYILFQPTLKQAYVGNVDKAKGSGTSNNALSFINMSRAELKANYDIKYIGQENVAGGIPTWHLELVPLKASNFKKANIWVDGNGMPIQMKVTENNNDTTTVLLSNLEKNVTINAASFKISYPKDTKIIRS